MGTKNKAGHPEWREERRKRAWELHQQGWKQVLIAEAMGVTEGAVSQWLKRARENGVEALAAKYAPGATPRLSAIQRAQLPDVGAGSGSLGLSRGGLDAGTGGGGDSAGIWGEV